MAASRLVITAPALLGLALMAWAWWGLPGAEEEAPPRHVAAPLLAPPAVTRAQPEPPVALPAYPPAPIAPAAVGLPDLLGAPDTQLRTSVQAALGARAQGGRLYARALVRRCTALAELPLPPEAPDANDARHQRAVARQAVLAAACRQFTDAEWRGLVNIGADEAGPDDPLLAVQQSDLDDAPLLQAVFARPDPLLLEELGARLLQRRLGGEPVLVFDGRRFDSEAERSLAEAALRLLPCEFGLACDERDSAVWLACLRGEGCAASRAAREPAEAQALAQRIAAALRQRELARFLPPP